MPEPHGGDAGMSDARRIPREAWVAAGLGLVLLAAALFVHTTVLHPADRSPVTPESPEELGEKPVSAANGGRPAFGPSFSLSVSPAHTTAKAGDTVRYLMTIRPEGGFDAPISLSLAATALYGTVAQTRDLGVIEPPYDPITYDVVAPDLPFPVSETTIGATVTATGGGLTRTQALTLRVTR